MISREDKREQYKRLWDCRTHKYKLLPTKRQRIALNEITESQRVLYNAALQQRKEVYQCRRKSISYIDQCLELTQCRKDISGMAGIPVNVQRSTLKRLDRSFQDFFRRISSGQEPGYPRFKSRERMGSFGFNEMAGLRILNGKLKFNGMPGRLKIHLHRPFPGGEACSCMISKDPAGQWYIAIQFRFPKKDSHSIKLISPVGIDLGIRSLATTSNGEVIPTLPATKKYEKQLRVAQRSLSRSKPGSITKTKKRINIARIHKRIFNCRHNHLHQASRRLVNNHDFIVMEDLRIKNMIRNRHLSKSIQNCGWGYLLNMITYKAEEAGGKVILVDPRNTSQQCSSCGKIVPKKLSQRRHVCGCGADLDRDQNAAINILKKGLKQVGSESFRNQGGVVLGSPNAEGLSATCDQKSCWVV